MSATETVSSDKKQTVVSAFVIATTEGRGFAVLPLQGPDPEAEYKRTWIEGKSGSGIRQSASGAWRMNHGLALELRSDFQALPSASNARTNSSRKDLTFRATV